MSRSELLQWLNETFNLNYRKVENCGTGAAFCLIMNSIYNDIPIHKLRLNATSEYEYRMNWKILQSSFNKHNVTKIIDVDKLIKCRLQDNLELLQWLRKYWEENAGRILNNDLEKELGSRKLSESNKNDTGLVKDLRKTSIVTRSDTRNVSNDRNSINDTKSAFNDKRSVNNTRNASYIRSSINSTRSFSNDRNSLGNTKLIFKDGNSTTFSKDQQNTRIRDDINYLNGNQSNYRSSGKIPDLKDNSFSLDLASQGSCPSDELIELRNENTIINNELQEYKLSADSLETERNFYFNKLRDIEVLTQNIMDFSNQNKMHELGNLNVIELTRKIQEILYSTQEGFQLNENDESF